MKSQDSNKPIFYKDKIKQKKTPDNTNSRAKDGIIFRPKTIRQIIGSIIDDAIFLEKLSNNHEFSQALNPVTGDPQVDKFAELIRENAREAVDFFAKKTVFWEECSKMSPYNSF